MTWGDTLYLLPEVIVAIGACLLLIAPVSGFRNPATAKRAIPIEARTASPATTIGIEIARRASYSS